MLVLNRLKPKLFFSLFIILQPSDLSYRTNEKTPFRKTAPFTIWHSPSISDIDWRRKKYSPLIYLPRFRRWHFVPTLRTANKVTWNSALKYSRRLLLPCLISFEQWWRNFIITGGRKLYLELLGNLLQTLKMSSWVESLHLQHIS